MSQFEYNGIQLQLIRTDSVTRDIRLSEDKVEYMWTDFTISLQCIYNPAATSYSIAGQDPGNLPMVTDVTIRHYLMQPRRPIFFEEGGIEILSIPSNIANGGAIDCEDGPIPQYCNITRIASSRLFYVNYSVKCSIIECPIGSFVSAIATSRYSRHESIGEDFLSTMTVSGVTVFRSNVLAFLAQNADSFRGYIIPAQLLGYKRTNLTFNLHGDGITLEWTATDVEQKQDLGNFSTPGSAASIGITKMGLTYQAGQLGKGSLGFAGYGSLVNVRCWADGVRGASTLSMMQFIFRVAWDKLINIFPIGVLASCELMEDVFNNHVQMDMAYMLASPIGGFNDAQMPIKGAVGILVSSLPNFSGINPGPPFSKGTRGTAAYQLAVNAFATACFTSPATVGQDETGSIIPPDAYNQSTQTGTSPQVQGYYSPGDPSPSKTRSSLLQQGNAARIAFGGGGLYPGQKVFYTKYELTSSYKIPQNVINLPVAVSQSGNSGSLSGGGSGNGNDSVNIQLFKPSTMKQVAFSIERVGAPPEIPNPVVPEAYADNYTLLRVNLSPTALEVMPDGYTPIYRVSGFFEYSLLTTITASDSIPYDIPPWIATTPNQATQINQSDYEDGIINNSVNT